MKEIMEEYGALLADAGAMTVFLGFFLSMLYGPVGKMIEQFGMFYF